MSILFILFSLIIIDQIKPIKDLLFFKQFIILFILYLIILPIISILISNLYFHIRKNKEWIYWLKIPEYYDDIFKIISIFPFLFLIIEVAIFCGYYTKLFKMNEIFIVIIFSIIGGIIYILSQKIIRKIFMK